MYFAVLQGGAESLSGRDRASDWKRKLRVGAAALPMTWMMRGYSAALHRLARVRVRGTEPAAPAILCLWHHDLFLILPERGSRKDWLALPPEPRVDPIARASESLGFRIIRQGFGDDGTPPAELVERVREEGIALLSVDGPKQPGLVRPDAVALAVQTGAPLVPLTVRAERETKLPGGMRLALPRGEIELRFGEPISVSKGGEAAAAAALAAALR